MVSGAAIVTEQLARGMAVRGHQVLVIAASDTGQPYTETEQNLTVMRLKSIRNPLRIKQCIMFMQRRAVLQALNEFRPDLIHVHEPIQMGPVGLKYIKRVNIPIVMTSHQLPWFVASYMPNLPRLRAWIEKLLWRYARKLTMQYTMVISPTRTISRIIEANTGSIPITINYGIDQKVYHPYVTEQEVITLRKKYNIPENTKLILHTGRLDADKHVDRVIRSLEGVIKKSGAHLLIVGDGCEKPKLMKLCKSLEIEKYVHFPGFIYIKDELAVIYRSSNIFVTASEIETQGIVILEAIACGLPVVAVDATCIPEVVHHNANGYTTNPGDIDAMAKAIEKILQNPSLANSMRAKSLLLAKRYNIEFSFVRHEEFYYQLHENKRALPAHGLEKYTLMKPNK
jgi:glycosyltransferase involved in cell wall biosynthesis